LLEPSSPARRAGVIREESLNQLVGSHFPQQGAAGGCSNGLPQQPPPPIMMQQQQMMQPSTLQQSGAASNACFGNSVSGGTFAVPVAAGVNPTVGAGQLGGASVYGLMYGDFVGNGADGPANSQQQPQSQPQPPVVLAEGIGAGFGSGNGDGGAVGGDAFAGDGSARRDPFLSASKACVRADGPRCGRLEASKMLSVIARFGLTIPPDMAAAAKRKGMCSYTIFIDRLREVAAADGDV
jgi:hypothetical protein